MYHVFAPNSEIGMESMDTYGDRRNPHDTRLFFWPMSLQKQKEKQKKNRQKQNKKIDKD